MSDLYNRTKLPSSFQSSTVFKAEQGFEGAQENNAVVVVVSESGLAGDEIPVVLNTEQGMTGGDGKSAYEVAVSNGFIGTEAEWLEALGNGGTPSWDSVINKPNLSYQQDFLNTNVIVLAHNMRKNPSVRVVDTGGNTWIPTSVTYTDLNNTTVTFDSTFSGTVFLS